MNWKRGLFRLWLVATFLWLGVATYYLAGGLTAVMKDVPPGVNKYACILAQIRTPCPQWPMVPDWDTRLKTASGLIAAPIIVPILGFALFWAGRLVIKIAKWIAQGFRA